MSRTTRTPAAAPVKRRRMSIVAAIVVVIVGSIGVWLWRHGSANAIDPMPPDAIILVTIDTLRADSVGYAGNRDVETPFLDELARGGRVFTNAHAHNVMTLASHANILTGLYPYQHGVRDNAGFVLDSKIPTIATLLRDRGWKTGAFVGAFPLDQRFGLARGFDVYDDQYREGSGMLDFAVQQRTAAEVLTAARTWWDSQPPGTRRFMWIHLYDPHAPYTPPEPFASKYANRPYLGEVASTDHALAEALGGIIRTTPGIVTIITSDHGEGLGDHGEATHGLFAYESTLAVPLIINAPGRVDAGTDDRLARHVDLAPTILHSAGVDKTTDMRGVTLLDDTKKEPIGDSYFEALSASLNRGWAPLTGVIHGGVKYIDLPIPELYDLRSDPAETKNLANERRRDIAERKKALETIAGTAGANRAGISGEERSRLLALGYLAGQTRTKESYTEADDPKRLVHLDNRMHEAVTAYQNGSVQEAVKTTQAILTERPDMDVAQEMLAFFLQQKGKSSDAIVELQRAIQRGTASDAVRIRLAMMLSESGRAQEAVEVMGPVRDHDTPEALNALGIAMADTGHPAEAVAKFERTLTIDPTNATAWQNLGVVALRQGDVTRARTSLTKALQLNDRLPLALNTMGVVHAQAGETDLAIASWKRAVELDPAQFDAMYNIAMIAAQAGRMDESRTALERFIASAPHDRYGPDIANARSMLAKM